MIPSEEAADSVVKSMDSSEAQNERRERSNALEITVCGMEFYG
jgi:hypothetical protein